MGYCENQGQSTVALHLPLDFIQSWQRWIRPFERVLGPSEVIKSELDGYVVWLHSL